MGYIGSSLASVNSGRRAESRRERLAIESDIRQAEAARRYELDKPARERATQQAEHERRELRKDLILGYEGSDFTNFPTYDGHLGDATPDQIAAAIQAVTGPIFCTKWNVSVTPVSTFVRSRRRGCGDVGNVLCFPHLHAPVLAR